jgi:hypothetical protein
MLDHVRVCSRNQIEIEVLRGMHPIQTLLT